MDKYSASGTLLKSTKVTAVTFDDVDVDLVNQTILYKVTALPNDAKLKTAISNIITIVKETNLFYPNIFTPNNDNLNDTFTVQGQFISKISSN